MNSNQIDTQECQNTNVFLRLRPLNQLELSKRSRRAIEVVDEKHVAVDDPEQGDWELELDGVRLPISALAKIAVFVSPFCVVDI